MLDVNIADISVMEGLQANANASMCTGNVGAMGVFNAYKSEPLAKPLANTLKSYWANFNGEKAKFEKAVAALTEAKKSGDDAAQKHWWDAYQLAKGWMIDCKESIENIQKSIRELSNMPETSKSPVLPKFVFNQGD